MNHPWKLFEKISIVSIKILLCGHSFEVSLAENFLQHCLIELNNFFSPPTYLEVGLKKSSLSSSFNYEPSFLLPTMIQIFLMFKCFQSHKTASPTKYFLFVFFYFWHSLCVRFSTQNLSSFCYCIICIFFHNRNHNNFNNSQRIQLYIHAAIWFIANGADWPAD